MLINNKLSPRYANSLYMKENIHKRNTAKAASHRKFNNFLHLGRRVNALWKFSMYTKFMWTFFSLAVSLCEKFNNKHNMKVFSSVFCTVWYMLCKNRILTITRTDIVWWVPCRNKLITTSFRPHTSRDVNKFLWL